MLLQSTNALTFAMQLGGLNIHSRNRFQFNVSRELAELYSLKGTTAGDHLFIEINEKHLKCWIQVGKNYAQTTVEI